MTMFQKNFFLPGDCVDASAPVFGSMGTVLRYRGVAYRPSDLCRAPRRIGCTLIYRGVAYRRTTPAPSAAPLPGQMRYRGVAY